MVECDVDRTMTMHDPHSRVGSVPPSYVEVSCDVVDILRDVVEVVVRTHLPTTGRSIRRPWRPVDPVAAAANVVWVVDTGSHHGNIPQDTDDCNNWRNLSNCPTIHNYRNYFVLRRRPPVRLVEYRVVPTIPIDCHIRMDKYPVGVVHN